MKIQILMLLGSVCAVSGVAGAQTKPDVVPELKKWWSPEWVEQELGPLPKLDPKARSGTKIRVLKTSRGEVFQVEAVRQSLGDMLRTITAVMGVRAVIDPKLDELRVSVVAFRANNWEQVIASVGVVESWKSASGTYFFAALPGVDKVVTQQEQNLKQEQMRRADPRQDLLVYSYGGLNGLYKLKLKDLHEAPEPQPHWEKREFNGHDFYYIPLPIIEKSTELETSK